MRSEDRGPVEPSARVEARGRTETTRRVEASAAYDAQRPAAAASRGFALPLVLGFLLALSLIGATATLLTTSDLRTGALYASSDRAFEAASAALDLGVDTYEERGADPGAWPLTGTDAGFAYRVDLIRDSFDLGGGRRPVSIDPLSDPELNDAGRGEPVHVLVSTASRRLTRSAQRLWITPISPPRLPAAITVSTRAATTWRGGWLASGTNVSLAGAATDAGRRDTAGLCAENRAAIHIGSDTGGSLSVEMNATGNPVYGSKAPPYTTRGRGPGWRSPEDVLGVAAGALDAHRSTGFAHHVARPDTLSGVTWITDDAGRPSRCLARGSCSSVQGRGILIIHNPAYDPREHDPQDPLYNPLKALSSLHRPARLHDVSGGTFRGLVIVDELPSSPSGGFSIIGGVVELSRGGGSRVYDWPSSTSVRYSCEALVDAARMAGLGPLLLGWTSP